MMNFPERDKVVPRHVLERIANETPEKEAFLFEDGTTWSYAQALQEGYISANKLLELGVRRNDHVAIFLPNDIHSIRAWLGAVFIDAVVVPVNTSYKGEMLKHICNDSKSKFIITSPSLGERLNGLDVSLQVVDPVLLTNGSSEATKLNEPIEPWHTHVICYTSGTTGLSKAVVCSYLHSYMINVGVLDYINSEDVFLGDHPLYHMYGLAHLVITLSVGAKYALRETFSLNRYFEVLQITGATMAGMIGSIPIVVEQTPPKPDDHENNLRLIITGPVFKDTIGMKKRLGVDYCFGGYGMTEMGAPLQNWDVEHYPASCGKPRPGIECRLVDDNDIPVPADAPGELIVRSDRPWELFTEYYRLPEETARVWRNGWFHTGDILKQDEDGYYYFVDRKKDTVRRRGENISSFEVEREIRAFPAVLDVACVAVLSEHGEGEVKVFVIPRPGMQLDPAELIHFLIPKMPHFMIPRYVEVVDDFPRAEGSVKVLKYQLRERGNNSATWDREAAGIKVTRY